MECYNVKNYRIDIWTDKFRRFELSLLGVPETHILGVGNMKLGDIKSIYSARKNVVRRQGAGLMMNKEAARYH